MTSPPTEQALAKATALHIRLGIIFGSDVADKDDVMIGELARALDAEQAAVWEEAAKMVNELWSATVPLLPASFIGLGASISRRAGKSRPRRRTGARKKCHGP